MQAIERADEGAEAAPADPKKTDSKKGERSSQDAGGATIDRDSLHEADYGSRREPDGADAVDGKEGGTTADEAEGGGRVPVAERDRDYDPDGGRTTRR